MHKLGRYGVGYREELTDYVNDAAAKGFKWGENDCALFANNALHKVFNHEDVGAKFRGKYDNYADALRVTKQLGYKDIPDIANQHLTQVNRPQTGDLALYIDNRCLGIVIGGYSYFLTGEFLTRIPNRMCSKFWGIRCQQQSL